MNKEHYELGADPELYEAIGPWTEVKHEIVRKYAKAYSTILTTQQHPRFHHVYVDAFAGTGRYISRRSRQLVSGSAEIALEITPPFQEYHLIDIDDLKVARLEQIAGKRPDVTVHQGDCNEVLIERVLPRVQYRDYRRGLCILDPYGMHLQWSTVEAVGKMASVDIFLNFPIMDMNRNVLRRDPSSIAEDQARRMTTFWGDESWHTLFYQPAAQVNLWGERPAVKAVTNELVAEAYAQRLRDVAGFKFVPPPLPMHNSANAILYYLFFASHKLVAGDIVEQIFDKYRGKGQQ